MQSGVLKKWLDNKNYGFITPDGSDQDIFVHRTQFVGLSEESGLQEGQPVVFNQISDDKGRIRAENVNGPNGSLVLVGRTPSNPFGRVRGRGFGRGDRGRGGRGGRGGFENRPFDGNCNSCGAQGHRSRECPSNPGQGPVDGQYGRSNFRTNSPSGGYDNNRGRGGRYPSAFSRGRRGGRGGDYNGRGRGRFGGDDQQGGRGGFGDRNFGDSGDRGRGRGGRGRGRGGRRGGGDFNRGGYSDRGHGDSGRGAFSSPPPQQYNPFSRPSYNSSDAPQRFDAGGRGLGGGQFSNNRQPGRGGSFPNSGRFGSPDGQRGGFGGRF